MFFSGFFFRVVFFFFSGCVCFWFFFEVCFFFQFVWVFFRCVCVFFGVCVCVCVCVFFGVCFFFFGVFFFFFCTELYQLQSTELNLDNCADCKSIFIFLNSLFRFSCMQLSSIFIKNYSFSNICLTH